jgi:hypothetical protein
MTDPLTEAETILDNNGVDVVIDTSTADADAAAPVVKLPQKRFFRQRAHANPFSDHLLE